MPDNIAFIYFQRVMLISPSSLQYIFASETLFREKNLSLEL